MAAKRRIAKRKPTPRPAARGQKARSEGAAVVERTGTVKAPQETIPKTVGVKHQLDAEDSSFESESEVLDGGAGSPRTSTPLVNTPFRFPKISFNFDFSRPIASSGSVQKNGPKSILRNSNALRANAAVVKRQNHERHGTPQPLNQHGIAPKRIRYSNKNLSPNKGRANKRRNTDQSPTREAEASQETVPVSENSGAVSKRNLGESEERWKANGENERNLNNCPPEASERKTNGEQNADCENTNNSSPNEAPKEISDESLEETDHFRRSHSSGDRTGAAIGLLMPTKHEGRSNQDGPSQGIDQYKKNRRGDGFLSASSASSVPEVNPQYLQPCSSRSFSENGPKEIPGNTFTRRQDKPQISSQIDKPQIASEDETMPEEIDGAAERSSPHATREETSSSRTPEQADQLDGNSEHNSSSGQQDPRSAHESMPEQPPTSNSALRKGRLSRKARVQRPRKRPYTNVQKEIDALRKTTNLLIPRLPFLRLVKEVSDKVGATGLLWEKMALMALQEFSEMTLVNLFEKAYLCTLHAGRITLMQRDLILATALTNVLP